MTIQEFSIFLNKPCRFKLKSGKEVFGVIWVEKSAQGEKSYYFTSPGDYAIYLRARQENDRETCEHLRHPLNLSEIVGATILEEVPLDAARTA